jgi:hypothetical protein
LEQEKEESKNAKIEVDEDRALTSKTVDATATSKEVGGDEEESRRFSINFLCQMFQKARPFLF